MSNISKEILRDYINEQKFTSPNEVLAAMKSMFKDILQETLEAEMVNLSLKYYLSINGI